MNTISRLPWPLIGGLSALALVRPLVSIIEHQTSTDSGPVVPIVLTIAITATWVLAVGLTSTPHPLVTLVATGVLYGVIVIVASAILSPILTGELQGPAAIPFAIIPVLLTNAGWGLIAGLLALLLQRLRRAHTAKAV